MQRARSEPNGISFYNAILRKALLFRLLCNWGADSKLGFTPDERTIFAYATAASSSIACSYSAGLRYPSEECQRTRL